MNSPSTPALQAQIAQVSADIERQKELLKNLERNKSLLQRQLNDLRDPIARLPLEISSDIFIRCLPTYLGPGSHIPGLFLEICNGWTEIALSSPALWARMDFYLPRPSGFKRLLKLWFQRAGGHPLQLSVTGLMDDDVAAIVWENSSRLERLEFSAGEKDETESADSDESDSDSDGIEYWNIWGSGQPQPLPLLQSLHIHGRGNLELESRPFTQLLRLSPNLSRLILHDVEFDDDADVEASEQLVLPNLRCLMFHYDVMTSMSLIQHDMLPFIFAPSLQTLGLIAEGTLHDGQRIKYFLDRSKPSLEELILRNAGDADDLYCLLALVPTLTRFELQYPTQDVVEDLFARLAEPPCGLLPSLQTFTVCLVHHGSTPLPWETTLRLITTRRTRLRKFHVIFYSDSHVQVPANILTAFRDISAEGVDIFLGLPGRNLLLLQ
ncbi:hypothetical protein FB45DRAFT_900951 [Roridomyces roridus]|uniref:F-box domain-containing protein n=1 Tax=Roridomyces roridus TaxID=1738132 RepID=A0AAD7C8I6_9AGAR|nr:hypothetical protein FB45DRAFT_900951 [Roridomyces roridus]